MPPRQPPSLPISETGHPVVAAVPHATRGTWVIKRCPFCGLTHEHSPHEAGEGLYLALCPEGEGPKPVGVYHVRLYAYVGTAVQVQEGAR